MSYDIVYSTNVHEEPECVHDLIQNIKYYNQHLNVAIILNCNTLMYNALKDMNIPNVYVNPEAIDKFSNSIGVFQGLLENYKYLLSLKLEFTYYITIASNCYFHKPVTMDYLAQKVAEQPAVVPEPNYRTWRWPEVFHRGNHNLNSFLKEKEVILYFEQHEGQIHTRKTFDFIVETFKGFDIYNNIAKNTTYEEFLPSSLYGKCTGKRVAVICKVFWDQGGVYMGTFPSIQTIEALELPMVKRVARKYNDPVRVHFRNKTKNYSVV